MATNISLTSKQVTRGLVSYLNKTKRMGILPQVLREAKKATRNYSDPNLAIVESAIPLTKDQEDAIKTLLTEKRGKETEIESRVNPKLIAGLRIKLGDTVIDQSIAHQIDQLAASVHG